jgi:hypothetical protein
MASEQLRTKVNLLERRLNIVLGEANRKFRKVGELIDEKENEDVRRERLVHRQVVNLRKNSKLMVEAILSSLTALNNDIELLRASVTSLTTTEPILMGLQPTLARTKIYHYLLSSSIFGVSITYDNMLAACSNSVFTSGCDWDSRTDLSLGDVPHSSGPQTWGEMLGSGALDLLEWTAQDPPDAPSGWDTLVIDLVHWPTVSNVEETGYQVNGGFPNDADAVIDVTTLPAPEYTISTKLVNTNPDEPDLGNFLEASAYEESTNTATDQLLTIGMDVATAVTGIGVGDVAAFGSVLANESFQAIDTTVSSVMNQENYVTTKVEQIRDTVTETVQESFNNLVYGDKYLNVEAAELFAESMSKGGYIWAGYKGSWVAGDPFANYHAYGPKSGAFQMIGWNAFDTAADNKILLVMAKTELGVIDHHVDGTLPTYEGTVNAHTGYAPTLGANVICVAGKPVLGYDSGTMQWRPYKWDGGNDWRLA